MGDTLAYLELQMLTGRPNRCLFFSLTTTTGITFLGDNHYLLEKKKKKKRGHAHYRLEKSGRASFDYDKTRAETAFIMGAIIAIKLKQLVNLVYKMIITSLLI